MQHAVDHIFHAQLERNLPAVAQVRFAVTNHRHISSDNQSFVTGVTRAIDKTCSRFAVFRHIELKPQRGAGGLARHLLHRLERSGRQHKGHVSVARGARQRDVGGKTIDAGGPGRCHAERRRIFLAKESDLL